MMDIVQVLTIFGFAIANIGTILIMFIWSTKLSTENRKQTARLLEAIQLEMKDFHGRLCAIEERNRK